MIIPILEGFVIFCYKGLECDNRAFDIIDIGCVDNTFQALELAIVRGECKCNMFLYIENAVNTLHIFIISTEIVCNRLVPRHSLVNIL